jgi:ERCC4-type nuclease
MPIIVDTREPPKYYEFLVKKFPEMIFKRMKLNEGDYQSEKCLAERKTVADLYGSITGPSRRIHDQVERISVHQDKVQILLVTGSVGQYVTSMRDIGITIDPNILFGEIASITCRYQLVPLWVENEWEGMITLIKLMKKIEDGKYNVPVRRDRNILASRLLGISTAQLEHLMMSHKCLHEIANVSEKDLQRIKGIGPAKAIQIKKTLRERF